VTVRFGERLRSLRKVKGWTQVQMADHLGIDRSYISDMEQGKKNVCLPTLEVNCVGIQHQHRKARFAALSVAEYGFLPPLKYGVVNAECRLASFCGDRTAPVLRPCIKQCHNRIDD
jgi:DNA-binding XRE family transcriptional regulator